MASFLSISDAARCAQVVYTLYTYGWSSVRNACMYMLLCRLHPSRSPVRYSSISFPKISALSTDFERQLHNIMNLDRMSIAYTRTWASYTRSFRVFGTVLDHQFRGAMISLTQLRWIQFSMNRSRPSTSAIVSCVKGVLSPRTVEQ
jgi:hypothetical protein